MKYQNIFLIFILTINLNSSCYSVEKDKNMTNNKNDLATFGGGCFWCTEAIFERVNGVVKVTSGYSGGEKENPTYDEVCSEVTEHAEVVQVEYDSNIISYASLLEIFFKTHNPTTVNRQGVDIGTQYRSIVLYHDNEQKEIVEKIINELNQAGIWDTKIVTEVKTFDKFYSAEINHQDYFARNSRQMYCQMTIVPKLEKFEKLFKQKLKK